MIIQLAKLNSQHQEHTHGLHQRVLKVYQLYVWVEVAVVEIVIQQAPTLVAAVALVGKTT
jgi:hypothetical protein